MQSRTKTTTRTVFAMVLAAALLLVAPTASVANPWEHADIVGQDSNAPDLVVDDGAAIRRLAGGVTAKVTMPTPEPGSYAYPQGPTGSGEPGHPETFSTWVFIFFNPEACDGACNGPDLVANPDVVAGAFNAGGHVVGGDHLTMTGQVNGQSAVFGGSNAETVDQALAMGYTIADAEIHVAVAPHGALDPELLPEAITTPIGNPSFWWIALFT